MNSWSEIAARLGSKQGRNAFRVEVTLVKRVSTPISVDRAKQPSSRCPTNVWRSWRRGSRTKQAKSRHTQNRYALADDTRPNRGFSVVGRDSGRGLLRVGLFVRPPRAKPLRSPRFSHPNIAIYIRQIGKINPQLVEISLCDRRVVDVQPLKS